MSDGNGGTDTATVTVTVNGVNEAPVAVSDSASLDVNETVVIDVLANDSDANGDILSVTSATAVNGTVSIDSNGHLTYTPNLDFSGMDTISYTISDGIDSASNSVSITVNSPNLNAAPTAIDDAFDVTENTQIILDVLSNDQDADGDILTVTTANATNGSVVINNDGTLSYTPSQGFTGSDSLTYTISDGNGGLDTATVSLTVNAAPGNTNPVGVDDEMTVEAGSNSVIANFVFVYGQGIVDTLLLSNDTDADGDSLTVIEADGQALNGQAIFVEGSNGGVFKILPSGYAELDTTSGFDNVPAGGSTTTSITYTLSDGNGGTDTATVTVTINGVNDDPNAVNDSVTATESSSVVIDMLANDTDIDSDALSVSSLDTSNLQGNLVDNGDGTFTYDANQQFDYLSDGQTATDIFEYSIDDGLGGIDTAQVMITIQGSTINTIANTDTSSTPDNTVVDGSNDGSNDFMV